MIVLSNTAAQTITPGQSIIFDEVLLHTGSAECHRRNTASVNMKSQGIYAVSFSGNIGGVAAGATQLSINAGGSPLPETTMISTTAAAGDLNNVSTETRVSNQCCCDYSNLAVTNTGTTDITVGANSAFVVNRVA